MKRMCKRFFASALALVLLCVCIPFCAQADDICGENVFRRYDAETDTYYICGSGATFDFDSSLYASQDVYTRVVIEAGVTYLGAYLFNCDSIGELVLPDAPLTVDENAFFQTEIDRIIFPQTATDVSQYDFGNEFDVFGNGHVYALDLGGLDGFPNGFRFGSGDNYDLQELIVGANTTEIPEYTCNCFGMLVSLTLPDGLLSIGMGAFESCEPLESVHIPDSVTTIGDYAFDYCVALKSVTLPKNLVTIGEWAFCTCEQLTSIKIPEKVTTIGISAFENCTNLADVTIPDSVTSIGENAFSGTALQSVHLPAGLQSIDASSFGNSLTFVCCSSEDCPAVRQFAQTAGIEFRLCNGHGVLPRTAGDADGDEQLTLRDIVMIRRYLAGGWDVTIDETAADVDGDGEVTLQDNVLLSRYIAGGWDVVLL